MGWNTKQGDIVHTRYPNRQYLVLETRDGKDQELREEGMASHSKKPYLGTGKVSQLGKCLHLWGP